MTDKFEEWLEWIIQANLFSKSLPFDARAHEDFYNAGQHDLAKEALAKYREFLKEQSKSALQQSNHTIGCELEAIATVLEFRKLTDEAETLRVVAARLK